MNEELKDRIKQLENDLKGTEKEKTSMIIFSFLLDHRFNDRNTTRDFETRLADLQSKLNQREQELVQLKHGEEKRLHFLRTAMLDYIGRGTKTTK
jgi:cell division septum initiation protein DivIVA